MKDAILTAALTCTVIALPAFIGGIGIGLWISRRIITSRNRLRR